MKILKNILLLLITLLLSYVTSTILGNVYAKLFPSNLGGALPTNVTLLFLGLPLAYIFFLTLLFTAFGDGKKYWWIGVLLVPAFWFEISFDPSHLYLPLVLGLLGWLLGFGTRKFLFKKK